MKTLNIHPFFVSFFCLTFVFLFINTSSLESLDNNKDDVSNREITSASSSFIFITAEELTNNKVGPNNGTFDSNSVKMEVCNNPFGGDGCTLTSCGGCDSSGNATCCQEGYETCPYWIAGDIK